jgi:hypothetical protein
LNGSLLPINDFIPAWDSQGSKSSLSISDFQTPTYFIILYPKSYLLQSPPISSENLKECWSTEEGGEKRGKGRGWGEEEEKAGLSRNVAQW